MEGLDRCFWRFDVEAEVGFDLVVLVDVFLYVRLYACMSVRPVPRVCERLAVSTLSRLYPSPSTSPGLSNASSVQSA